MCLFLNRDYLKCNTLQICLKLKCNVSRRSKYLSIIDFVFMLVEYDNNSFKFLFNLRTNACSNESNVLKNEMILRCDKEVKIKLYKLIIK